MNPKHAFFKQFPKGCPNCGARRRFIVVGEPSEVEEAPYWDRIRRTLWPGPIRIVCFAECQRCHEAWSWQDESKTWINTREMREYARAKAVTERAVTHSPELTAPTGDLEKEVGEGRALGRPKRQKELGAETELERHRRAPRTSKVAFRMGIEKEDRFRKIKLRKAKLGSVHEHEEGDD